MKKTILAVTLLAVLSTLVLSACSSQGDGKILGVPSDLGYTYRTMDASEMPPTTGDVSNHASMVNGTTINVFLGGSSSCPPTIASIDNAKDGSVRINLKDWGSSPCTSDYALRGYEVTAVAVGFNFANKKVYTCGTTTCTELPFSQ